MKLTSILFYAALACALPEVPIKKRANEECEKSCVKAGEIQMTQCKQQHESNNALAVNECVCRLGDEYWNLLSACVKGCDEFSNSSSPQEPAELKRAYCQAVRVYTDIPDQDGEASDKSKTSDGDDKADDKSKTSDGDDKGDEKATSTKDNATDKEASATKKDGETDKATTNQNGSTTTSGKTEKSGSETTSRKESATDSKSASKTSDSNETETGSETKTGGAGAAALGVGSLAYLLAVAIL